MHKERDILRFRRSNPIKKPHARPTEAEQADELAELDEAILSRSHEQQLYERSKYLNNMADRLEALIAAWEGDDHISETIRATLKSIDEPVFEETGQHHALLDPSSFQTYVLAVAAMLRLESKGEHRIWVTDKRHFSPRIFREEIGDMNIPQQFKVFIGILDQMRSKEPLEDILEPFYTELNVVDRLNHHINGPKAVPLFDEPSSSNPGRGA